MSETDFKDLYTYARWPLTVNLAGIWCANPECPACDPFAGEDLICGDGDIRPLELLQMIRAHVTGSRE